MPQLQWLGDIEQESEGGYLAKALGGGVSKGLESFLGTKEKSEELDWKREELKSKMDALDFSKKMDAARLASSILSHVDEDKRVEMLDDPDIIAVFEAAGVPIPRTVVPEEKPGWFSPTDPKEVGAFDPRRALPGFAHTGGAGGEAGGGDMRAQAIKALKEVGAPTTEANIQSAIKQLGGK